MIFFRIFLSRFTKWCMSSIPKMQLIWSTFFPLNLTMKILATRDSANKYFLINQQRAQTKCNSLKHSFKAYTNSFQCNTHVFLFKSLNVMMNKKEICTFNQKSLFIKMMILRQFLFKERKNLRHFRFQRNEELRQFWRKEKPYAHINQSIFYERRLYDNSVFEGKDDFTTLS